MSGGSGISGAGGDAGSSDALFRMLRLLSDSSTLQAEYVRLDNARKDAQALIDKVGPASEVLAIREQIDELHAQAQESLQQANQEAATIVAGATAQKVAAMRDGDSAKTQAMQQSSQIMATARRVQEDADARVARVATQEKSVGERTTALYQREAALAERETAAEQAYQEALQLKGAIHETLADAHQKLASLST